MFRSVNIHNDKSNPTIVYEVELIQDADDSKIVVSQFQFETPPTFDKFQLLIVIVVVTILLGGLTYLVVDDLYALVAWLLFPLIILHHLLSSYFNFQDENLISLK